MAQTFQGLGPKRRESCNGDWVNYYCYVYLMVITILIIITSSIVTTNIVNHDYC